MCLFLKINKAFAITVEYDVLSKPPPVLEIVMSVLLDILLLHITHTGHLYVINVTITV